MSSLLLTRRVFLAGSTATAAGLALPPEAKARTIKLHLCGDSIAKGFGLGVFADRVPTTHPLYVFRSIWSMGNSVLAENGLAASFEYRGIGLHDRTPPMRLFDSVSSGAIRSGDWVIFEDAGLHGSDPDQYQSDWNGIIATAAAPGVNLAVLTMFDYPPAPLGARYDVSIRGRTMNDVNRAVAQAHGATLVDSNLTMDAWVRYAMENDGVSVMQADGIHPNVWGQLRMVKDLLIAVGLRSSLKTVSSLQAAAAKNYQLLAYGGASWTPTRAREYCATLLQP